MSDSNSCLQYQKISRLHDYSYILNFDRIAVNDHFMDESCMQDRMKTM